MRRRVRDSNQRRESGTRRPGTQELIVGPGARLPQRWRDTLAIALPGRYDVTVSLSEIKQLAAQLPPEDLTALTAFLVERDQAAWDDQMEQDAASGKLDRLFEEGESERAAGKLRNWPD